MGCGGVFVGLCNTSLFVYLFFTLGPYSVGNLSIPLFSHMAQQKQHLEFYNNYIRNIQEREARSNQSNLHNLYKNKNRQFSNRAIPLALQLSRCYKDCFSLHPCTINKPKQLYQYDLKWLSKMTSGDPGSFCKQAELGFLRCIKYVQAKFCVDPYIEVKRRSKSCDVWAHLMN